MRWNRLGAAAVVTALCVGVAACGGGDNGSSGGSSASSGAATKSTVKVGLITASGSFTASPDIVADIKAGVRALNERGGLAGHKVELDYCNDKSDASLAATCARRMVADKVVAVVGQIGLEDQISQPILEAAAIPEVLSRATAESVLNSKNVFLVVGGTSFSYPVAAGYFAKKLNLPYNFMISDTPGSLGLQKSLLERFKAAGMSPASVQRVNPKQADFSPVVSAATQGGAKAVLGILPYTQTQAFIKAAGSAGNPFQLVSAQAVFGPKDASSFGGVEQLDRTISAVPLPPLNVDLPGVKQFVEEIKAEAADGDGDAAVDKQSGEGFGAWLSLIGLEAAVKQQKPSDITAASLKTALQNAKDLDLAGLIPPWTPNQQGPAGFGRLSNDHYYLVGYKKGKPYLITPKAISVEDALAGKF